MNLGDDDPPRSSSSDDIAELTAEFNALREALLIVAESINGQSVSDGSQEEWVRRLAIKLFCHSSSAFYLARGTPIAQQAAILDHSSVAVLSRACIDVCSLVQYLFVDTMGDPALRKLRVSAWQLKDLMGRQSFETPGPAAATVLLNEKEEVEAIKAFLSEHPYFIKEGKGMRNRVLAGHLLPGWRNRELMTRAGFGRSTTGFYHHHSSSHVHSGRSASLQLERTIDEKSGPSDLGAPLRSIMFSLAVFIRLFMQLFEPARKALDQYLQLDRVVEMYAALAQK